MESEVLCRFLNAKVFSHFFWYVLLPSQISKTDLHTSIGKCRRLYGVLGFGLKALNLSQNEFKPCGKRMAMN